MFSFNRSTIHNRTEANIGTRRKRHLKQARHTTNCHDAKVTSQEQKLNDLVRNSIAPVFTPQSLYFIRRFFGSPEADTTIHPSSSLHSTGQQVRTTAFVLFNITEKRRRKKKNGHAY